MGAAGCCCCEPARALRAGGTKAVAIAAAPAASCPKARWDTLVLHKSDTTPSLSELFCGIPSSRLGLRPAAANFSATTPRWSPGRLRIARVSAARSHPPSYGGRHLKPSSGSCSGSVAWSAARPSIRTTFGHEAASRAHAWKVRRLLGLDPLSVGPRACSAGRRWDDPRRWPHVGDAAGVRPPRGIVQELQHDRVGAR